MSEQILSAVHGVTTMLFGIYCSAFFLGIKPIRKNILTMFLLFLGQGLLYVIDLALFGGNSCKYVLSSDRTFSIGFIPLRSL
ncbi:MAG: hypothetical protein ACLUGJ_06735 [Blautia wexlerae]